MFYYNIRCYNKFAEIYAIKLIYLSAYFQSLPSSEASNFGARINSNKQLIRALQEEIQHTKAEVYKMLNLIIHKQTFFKCF